jgi:predicted RNA-binding protein with PIN domain
MAETLILDGYNVIGALERYRGRSMDEARELLINDSLRAAGWTGREVWAVFDAARGGHGSGRTEKRAEGAVRVLYSAQGQTADDVIERLLKVLRGSLSVCSGDFAVQRAAVARGAGRLAPREFEAILQGLPALTRTPDQPFRTRVADRLPPETLRSLEEVRRKADGP